MLTQCRARGMCKGTGKNNNSDGVPILIEETPSFSSRRILLEFECYLQKKIETILNQYFMMMNIKLTQTNIKIWYEINEEFSTKKETIGIIAAGIRIATDEVGDYGNMQMCDLNIWQRE